MYYCDICAEKCGWPVTIFKSRGHCEICTKPARCNDFPASELPPPRTYRQTQGPRTSKEVGPHGQKK